MRALFLFFQSVCCLPAVYSRRERLREDREGEEMWGRERDPVSLPLFKRALIPS